MTVTTVIDETWTYHRDGYVGDARELVKTPGNDAHFGYVNGDVYFRESDADDAARAKLASAGPEMARALLAVEWSGGNLSHVPEAVAYCPDCGAVPWIEATSGRRVGNHEGDCVIDAALRKAGLR
jgi:hypothetical protein